VEALFERPTLVGVQLRHAPSAGTLDALADVLAWTRRSRHLALLVDIGADSAGAGEPPHRDGRDLAELLGPIAGRLGQVRLDAAFGRKRVAPFSRIRVARSRVASTPPPPPSVRVRLTAPATSIDWKQQLHDACGAVVVAAPPGPVAVQLRFTLSRRRDWTALWLPAVQSLGAVLGVPDPTRPYLAATDRVTCLALHRRLDDGLGPDVDVELWWWPLAEACAGPWRVGA
jgi:hypothetical protein